MLFSMLPLQHPTALYQGPIFLIHVLSPCVLAGDRAYKVPAQGLHLGHRRPSRDISPIAKMFSPDMAGLLRGRLPAAFHMW